MILFQVSSPLVFLPAGWAFGCQRCAGTFPLSGGDRPAWKYHNQPDLQGWWRNIGWGACSSPSTASSGCYSYFNQSCTLTCTSTLTFWFFWPTLHSTFIFKYYGYLIKKVNWVVRLPWQGYQSQSDLKEKSLEQVGGNIALFTWWMTLGCRSIT